MSGSSKGNVFAFHIGWDFFANMFISPFLDHTGDFYYFWHVSSFKVPQFFSISIYLFYHFLSLICYYLLVLSYQLERMFFFYGLYLYVWSVDLYFSFSLDCKVPENRSTFCFRYWFWLVFILIYPCLYSILLLSLLLIFNRNKYNSVPFVTKLSSIDKTATPL